MHYYKNAEIAELYGVSRRTVINWIEKAQAGSMDLELQAEKGKPFIAKTPKNQLVMKSAVQDRRKYLNRKSLKEVTPRPEFYELFNEAQILDIISNIDIYKEIPRQYNYFNGGAHLWDDFTNHLYESTAPNTLTQTIRLIDDNLSYIDNLLANHDRVNVVDVGVGNALPSKKLLAHLLAHGKLGRYVAIDISKPMLDIAKDNIQNWFGDKVHFEGYTRDISAERFADILAEPSDKNLGVINLVLLFGGTLSNFSSPEDGFSIIRKSMMRDDILVYAKKLDSATTRDHFDFKANDDITEASKERRRLALVLGFLNIDESYYDMEMGFNMEKRFRYVRVRLKHAINFEFKLSKGNLRIYLNKDDTILLLRIWHQDAFGVTSQLYENGFNPLLTSQTPDHDYMLILADLRKDGN